MKRKWDARTKSRIVLEGLTGGCVTDICREHNLRPGLYYKWRGQFLENCHKAFEPQQRTAFEAEMAQENERLKRLVGELTLQLNGSDGSR